MAEKFKIIFDGELAPSENLAAVQAELLKLYKGNQQAIAKIFSDGPVIIKDKVDRETAGKYQAAFKQAGALVKIVPESTPLSMTPRTPTDTAESSAVSSPPEKRAQAFAPPNYQQTAKSKANTAMIVNFAAITIVLAIFASLGLRFWASNKLDNFVSIDHVAANKDTVAIHAAGTIYLQSHDGKLKKQLPLEDLGINGKLADLEILDDGTLLVGDLETKNIYRCKPETGDCVAFAPTGYLTLAENFKFMVDQPRNQLYIADTNNHRLLIQNLRDSTCVSAVTDSTLNYPNDMARGSGNSLFLCDTNRFRVIPLEAGNDSVTQSGSPFSSMPLLPSSPENLQEMLGDPEKMRAQMEQLKGQLDRVKDDIGHPKPFALALGPDYNLWVVQLNTLMTNGTINIFSEEGELIKKVELDEGAMPEDIINLDNNLLVADSGQVRAYTIDPASHLVRNFGDEAFQKQLTDIHSHRSFLEGLKSFGLIGTVVLAVCALGVMLFAKREGLA